MTHVCTTHSKVFRSELKQLQLKVTPARMVVLDVLTHAKGPLSVAQIIKALPNKFIDQATVYRNLEFLTNQNLVNKLVISSKNALYEKSSAHHHHVVCTKCGKVEELKGCALPVVKKEAIKAKGFKQINLHNLEFFGVCNSC